MAPHDEQRLKLYGDLMSQPTRACAIFSRCHGLPVDVAPVYIHKGDHRKPAFTSLNPLGKVPLLEDPHPPNGQQESLLLPESAAIMTYLSNRFPGQVPEHWYPRADLVQRAHVDAALHWYHSTIRAGAMRLVFNKVLAARLGVPPNPSIAEEGAKLLQPALAHLQSVWLRGGSRPFMTGPQPCVADLLVACELEQLRLMSAAAHGTDLQQLLAPHPAVRDWMQAVRSATQPHYDEVHSVLMRSAAAVAKNAAAAPKL